MPAFPPDLTKTLTELVDGVLARTGAPGLGLSVFTADDVLLERGFGTRDREAGLPVTPDTIFGVASITKSVTALTTLTLQERGLIGLGDAVGRHLDFGDLWARGEPTVADFLGHTSGLPATPTMTWLRYSSQLNDPVTHRSALEEAKLTLVPGTIGMYPAAGGELSLDAVDAAAASMPDEEALTRLRALATEVGTFGGMARWLGRSATPLAAPGELYSYSNDAFCLVGGMLERVAGAPFPDLARREVLGPLSMTRSRFDLEGVLADPDHSTLYAQGSGGVTPSPAWETTGVMQGGGMLKSTLRDLRAYVRHLMAGGPFVSAMTRPRVSSAPDASYGLGLAIIGGYHGLTIVKHGGSLKGVSSAIGFVPELGVGVVVLCNLGGVPSEQLLVDVVNACADLPLGGAPYAPEPVAQAEPGAAGTADLIGEYLSGEPYGRLRLLADADGGLRVVAGWPEATLPAFVAGPDEVAVAYPDGRRSAVRFLGDGAGKVWSAQAGRVMLRL